jgi:hypothetical protein
MSCQTPINQTIIEQRMRKETSVYLQDCIDEIEKIKTNSLLDGLGELLNPKLKSFVKNKLHKETITLLRFYKEFPIVE